VDAVADRLHSAAIHLLRRLRVEDEALGLSAPRLSALSVLVFTGPQRIGELARLEQVEPPTMTRLVDALEEDGYVTREADPEDARAVIIRTTPRGTRALKRGQARRVEALRGSLQVFSPTELRSIDAAVEALDRALREPP
jgi:DNA-binding MarR family transcriptional regulator